MRKVILLSIIPIAGLISRAFAGVLLANTTDFTLVGKDSLSSIAMDAPGKRVDIVYRMGDDKVVLVCKNPCLFPIGEGDSMAPMVTKDHLVLATKDYKEIKVGDFVVVDGLNGRYFHQVVEIKDGKKGIIYMTRGINNPEDDVFPVFEDEIVGVAIAVIW